MSVEKKIEVRTCKFVEATDVFEGCRGAWDLFCDSEPDCNWGNNNRTLVTADTIIDALENCDESGSVTTPLHLWDEVETVISRLSQLGEDFYVDLEN